MSKNTLLLSVTILKDRTAIHTNTDEKLLYPEIKAAEDMFIHPKLGTALYNKLIADITATGTTTGDYLILLNDYIIDALLNYVLSELCITLPYQFWNKGILRKGGDTTEYPSMSELVDISNRYRDRAEWYGERLVRYLMQSINLKTLPEYAQPGQTIDTIVPERSAFTMPVYLGDYYPRQHLDINNCNCNPITNEQTSQQKES